MIFIPLLLMAGIYIHIPFCRKACHYCDFHFATSLKQKPEMVTALQTELDLQKNYLPTKDNTVQTIYFGGGTPSLLTTSELLKIFETIFENYSVAEQAEITLEANPDDLSLQKLRLLRHTPINRLSIGIQSFFEEDLKWMNRAHTAKEADVVLETALAQGFEDLTADLIYGYPLLSNEKWAHNISKLTNSGIQHLSAYSLTVEKGTPLDRFIHKKKQPPMDAGQSAEHFMFLMNTLSEKGWEQYEISNFAKNDHYSQHNTAYWQGIPYLGIGPSAHSFDGDSRQWNTRVNNRYIRDLQKGNLNFEKETLSREDKTNEYIMTSLRTIWGIKKIIFKNKFGAKALNDMLMKSRIFEEQKLLNIDEERVKLTQEGKLFADYIASELFVNTI